MLSSLNRSSLDRSSWWNPGVVVAVVVGLVGLGVLWAGSMPFADGDSPASAELVAASGAEPDLVVYFGETVPEAEALQLVRGRELGRVTSSYDTTHVRVGLIVPPTEQQLARLQSRTGVWRASIDGTAPRANDDTLSPEHEAHLEQKRRTGALCPTIYLNVAVAPHVAEATIHRWLQAIPTTAVPEIRKPANDVRVTPTDQAAAKAVRALDGHSAIELVAVIGAHAS